MPVENDPDSRRRWVQSEVEVVATPEQVWQAIATGPGITAWFMPTQFEPKPDGTPARVVTDFGEHGQAKAEITSWDPPRRFGAVTAAGAWGPGAPPVATEWHVDARNGGTCVVRVVHSLFADDDDWDGQLEDTGPGWTQFFARLKEHLEGPATA